MFLKMKSILGKIAKTCDINKKETYTSLILSFLRRHLISKHERRVRSQMLGTPLVVVLAWEEILLTG